jgi:hypothetical protein
MAKAAAKPLFEVDRAGLAKTLASRPKAFILAELFQNAADEDVSRIDIVLEQLGGDRWKLVVEDDNPEGFKNLAHAYTLFAESDKKDDPRKRGRFNLGEKLVIAVCEDVAIKTTKGTVVFSESGRYHLDEKRAKGTQFTATLRLTDDEAREIEQFVHTLIVPDGIEVTFGMETIVQRVPLATFDATLRTVRSDAEGNLRPTERKTAVEIYDPLPGETAMIYELGIPVVPTGDRFHVNVMQKVPLNMDRDNVPPAYLRDLRALVLNNAHGLMSKDDAAATWVTDALSDDAVEPEAVREVFAKRFGDKAVIHDPNDPEANKIAAENGYTVVPGRALPKAAWKNVKDSDVAKPAGQITPSPQPYQAEGEALALMNEGTWPDYVRNVADFAKMLAVEVLEGAQITVRVANDPTWPWAATYGPGLLTLNLGRLGHRWFEQINENTIDLLIHEFAHHYEADHLSRKYIDALSRIGARVWRLAMDRPAAFEIYGVATAA